MFSGRGLCYELITRPEEYYRLRCVVVCSLESSSTRSHGLHRAAAPEEKRIYIYIYIYDQPGGLVVGVSDY